MFSGVASQNFGRGQEVWGRQNVWFWRSNTILGGYGLSKHKM